jgi:hypothetical protein
MCCLLHAHVFAAPQDNAVSALPAEPDLGGPEGAAAGCGDCFVVANVAQIVWYSVVFANVVTRSVDVFIGNNTQSTRTATVVRQGRFLIDANNDDEDGSGLALTQVEFDSTKVVNGATLLSPTPYDVFQGYTLTSEVFTDGSCQTVIDAPSSLPEPFYQTAAQSDGAVFFNAEGEQRFLDFLQLSNCRPGGEVVSPTVVAQVQNITVDTTVTRPGGALAPPTRTLGPTIPLTITSNFGVTTLTEIIEIVTLRPTPALTRTTRLFPSAPVPVIIIGTSTTITPTPNPLPLPIADASFRPEAEPDAESVIVELVVPSVGAEDGNFTTFAVVPDADVGSVTVDLVVPTGGPDAGGITTAAVVPVEGAGSVTVELVVPTGGPGDGGATTVAVVPFISQANTWRKVGSSWVEFSVASAVGLCCAILLYL